MTPLTDAALAGELIPLGPIVDGVLSCCVWPPRECAECHTARAFGSVTLTAAGNVFVCFRCA